MTEPISLVEWLLLSEKIEIEGMPAMFRDIVYKLPKAVIGIFDDGKVFLWNNAAEKLFGYSEKEIEALGGTLDPIMPEMYRNRHKLRLAQNQDLPAPIIKASRPAITKSGREIIINISLYSLMQSNGRYFISVVDDVTE